MKPLDRLTQRVATGTDDGLSTFLSVRRRLFCLAYRMLGSAADAEDIVQDVWVRWQAADQSVVRDAAAFLATTTARLAINIMQSARSRRETCVGPWLPEPVDTSADSGRRAERGEALELGALVLLRLSPKERAAFILREAFDCSYRDIANVLRLEEANARQVVTRARQHVANARGMPHMSVGSLRVAFGRHTRGAGRQSPITFVQRSPKGSGQGSFDDHSRISVRRIGPAAHSGAPITLAPSQTY